jgi:hypothetical protein
MKVYLVNYKTAFHEGEYVIAGHDEDDALEAAMTLETGYSLDGKNVYRPDKDFFTVSLIEGVTASKPGVKTLKKINI